MVQSLPKGPTPEHCCIEETSLQHMAFGDGPDPKHTKGSIKKLYPGSSVKMMTSIRALIGPIGACVGPGWRDRADVAIQCSSRIAQSLVLPEVVTSMSQLICMSFHQSEVDILSVIVDFWDNAKTTLPESCPFMPYDYSNIFWVLALKTQLSA